MNRHGAVDVERRSAGGGNPATAGGSTARQSRTRAPSSSRSVRRIAMLPPPGSGNAPQRRAGQTPSPSSRRSWRWASVSCSAGACAFTDAGDWAFQDRTIEVTARRGRRRPETGARRRRGRGEQEGLRARPACGGDAAAQRRPGRKPAARQRASVSLKARPAEYRNAMRVSTARDWHEARAALRAPPRPQDG